MSENNKKVPKLRFPGFTDDWEQRKLEALCDVFTDGDWIEAKDQSDSGIRLVQTGNVGTTEYLDKENNKKWISEQTFERLHCEEIYEGDILISRLPEPAGRACIMPDLGTRMITAVDCTIVRTSKEYDSKYLVQYLSTPMYFKVVNSFLGGGTRQRISRGNLSGIDIPIPSTIDEQRKIGGYFSNLDNLITLHQRKCDEIKKLKKSMLQKMFPKEGERFPELRFPEFTDAWEQRKLSEMSDFITKGATPTTYGFDWVDEGIPFFRNDAIKDNQFVYGDYSYISEEANEALNRSEITGDDILVAITGDIGKVGIVPKTIEKANINQHTARVRIIHDAVPYFIYQSLAREEQQKIYHKIKTGLSMPQLSLEQIRETLILCPTYEEQTKIADALYNLDNLITLHQRKCDELKELKKGLLQQMFV